MAPGIFQSEQYKQCQTVSVQMKTGKRIKSANVDAKQVGMAAMGAMGAEEKMARLARLARLGVMGVMEPLVLKENRVLWV